MIARSPRRQHEPPRSPTALVHRLWRGISEGFRAAADKDLTLAQYIILQAVSTKKGLSQTAIQSLTGADRTSVSMLVRKLMAKGLLKRKRSTADARAYAVSLTESGQKSLRRAAAIVEQIDSRLLDEIDGQHLLKSLASSADALRGDRSLRRVNAVDVEMCRPPKPARRRAKV
jgi:DNA-binding MarR family transcriptional regulator